MSTAANKVLCINQNAVTDAEQSSSPAGIRHLDIQAIVQYPKHSFASYPRCGELDLPPRHTSSTTDMEGLSSKSNTGLHSTRIILIGIG